MRSLIPFEAYARFRDFKEDVNKKNIDFLGDPFNLFRVQK